MEDSYLSGVSLAKSGWVDVDRVLDLDDAVLIEEEARTIQEIEATTSESEKNGLYRYLECVRTEIQDREANKQVLVDIDSILENEFDDIELSDPPPPARVSQSEVCQPSQDDWGLQHREAKPLDKTKVSTEVLVFGGATRPPRKASFSQKPQPLAKSRSSSLPRSQVTTEHDSDASRLERRKLNRKPSVPRFRTDRKPSDMKTVAQSKVLLAPRTDTSTSAVPPTAQDPDSTAAGTSPRDGHVSVEGDTSQEQVGKSEAMEVTTPNDVDVDDNSASNAIDVQVHSPQDAPTIPEHVSPHLAGNDECIPDADAAESLQTEDSLEQMNTADGSVNDSVDSESSAASKVDDSDDSVEHGVALSPVLSDRIPDAFERMEQLDASSDRHDDVLDDGLSAESACHSEGDDADRPQSAGQGSYGIVDDDSRQLVLAGVCVDTEQHSVSPQEPAASSPGTVSPEAQGVGQGHNDAVQVSDASVCSASSSDRERDMSNSPECKPVAATDTTSSAGVDDDRGTGTDAGSDTSTTEAPVEVEPLKLSPQDYSQWFSGWTDIFIRYAEANGNRGRSSKLDPAQLHEDLERTYDLLKKWVRNRGREGDHHGRVLYYRTQRSAKQDVRDVMGHVMTPFTHWQEMDATEPAMWNMLWSWGKPKVKYDQTLQFQKINHYPNSGEISRKDRLYKNLRRHAMRVKCDTVRTIMPATFSLPQEYTDFCACFADAESVKLRHNLWILKPVGMSRGRGIRLVTDIGDVIYGDAAVLQRYVPDPFLIDGYKFDFRLYVLVTSFSPLVAFIYKDGFARFASRPFSLDPATINDKYVHVTNTAVQVDSEECPMRYGIKGQVWTTSKLPMSVTFEIMKHKYDVDIDKLWADIRTTVLTSLEAVDGQIEHQSNCFELFGYDILIDSVCRPWLLEVQASPSMEHELEMDYEIKTAVIRDTIRMVEPVPFDRVELLDGLAAKLGKSKKSKERKSIFMDPATAERAAFLETMEKTFHGRAPFRDVVAQGGFEALTAE